MQIGEWEYQKDTEAKRVNREFSEKLRALVAEYYMPRLCEHGDWKECEQGCEQGCEHADTRVDEDYLVGGVVACAYYGSLDPDKDGDMRWIAPEGQSVAVTHYLLTKAAKDIA